MDALEIFYCHYFFSSVVFCQLRKLPALFTESKYSLSLGLNEIMKGSTEVL